MRVMHLNAWSGPRGDEAVYIGRAGHGEDGYFGNPVVPGKRCPVCRRVHQARGETLPCFEVWARQRVQTDAEYKRRVGALQGKTLLCFCAVECHGYVLAKLADEINGTGVGAVQVERHVAQVGAVCYEDTRPLRGGEGDHVIHKVTTTFNGSPREYALEKGKTLVLGPTGSGKTTLLASLGLVLTSRGDDVVGRDTVAAVNDLALAMGEDQTSIRVEATLDGESAVWETVRGHKAQVWAKADPWNHPVREIKNMLAKGPESARADLAPLLLGDEPVAVHRLVTPQAARRLPEAMTITQIISRLDQETSSLADLRRKRNAMTDAVEHLERTLPQRPAPHALEAAEAALARAREAAMEIAAAHGQARQQLRRKDEIERQIASLKAEAATLAAQYQQASQRQLAAGANPTEGRLTDEQVENARAYVRVFGLGAPGKCPVCSTTVDLTASREHLQKVLERDAAARAADRQRQTNEGPSVQEIKEAYGLLGQRIQLLAEEHATIQIPDVPPIPTLDELDGIQRALRSAEDQWAQSQQLRAELTELQQAEANQSLVVDEMKRLIDMVYRERTVHAIEGVSRWLPPGHKLVLVLHSDSGARIFRLGLQKPNGKVATNPSGGQRSALLMAIALYLLTERRITPPCPVVMLAEERGFDPAWLGKVMRALEDSPEQVVLVSLVKPTGYRGKAWHTLTLPDEASENENEN